MRDWTRIGCWLLTGWVAASGCNMLTGASDLVLDDDAESGGADGATSGDGHPGATGSGAAGTGSGAGSGASGPTSSGTGEPPTPPPLADATGVTISEIAIYQGVKRPLMEAGSPADGVTIVEGRDAFVRVFVAVDAGYDGTPVTARLYLDDATMPIESVAQATASSDADLGSTFNFDVPGSAMHSGMSYRVELKQDKPQSSGANAAARYPASGSAPIEVESSGQVLKVKLVPVAYGADGSNRLPDTSAAQLAAYQAGFFAQYPVPAIELTVREAIQWDYGVYASGSGWDYLLDGIAQLRMDDGAPADVYYYGIFEPESSFGSYCSGGCLLGLGFIGGPQDSYTHAAIGLGFSGQDAVETGVHEIGHTHGRSHAPCGGVSGADWEYPHAGAAIGVWGYDLLTSKLHPPDDTADFMSYCHPAWVSDYTFQALFERIQFVNGASLFFPPEELDQEYERVRIGADGSLTWWSTVQLPTPPMGEPTPVEIATEQGTAELTGQLYRYDHLEGGVILWKKPQLSGGVVTIDLAGSSVSISR